MAALLFLHGSKYKKMQIKILVMSTIPFCQPWTWIFFWLWCLYAEWNKEWGCYPQDREVIHAYRERERQGLKQTKLTQLYSKRYWNPQCTASGQSMLAKTPTTSFCCPHSVPTLASNKFKMIPTRGANIMPRFTFSWEWPCRLSDLQIQWHKYMNFLTIEEA
jgi:hypothetical protein